MSSPTAEILSQGDEVVTGEISDTNATWLSRQIAPLGFDVRRHSVVGDHLDDLVTVLREISVRADLCLSTGGLGPTCDDLTAEAAAIAFGRPLTRDPEALAQIKSWFEKLNKPMPKVNDKQALLPADSARLDNLWGTAPGFALHGGGCRFYFMPGVPGEMKSMFQQRVFPQLSDFFQLNPGQRAVLNTVGIGESALQEILNGFDLPSAIRLGFRAKGPENQIKLAIPPGYEPGELNLAVARISETLGDSVYSVQRGLEPEIGLRDVVGQLLTARKATLFFAECVSGGALTHQASSEPWSTGGRVAPEPEALLADFDLEPSSDTGAMAACLAEEIRARQRSTYVLAQCGDFNRAALLCQQTSVEIQLALAGPNGSLERTTRTLTGGLQRKQLSATVYTLDFIRRALLGCAF